MDNNTHSPQTPNRDDWLNQMLNTTELDDIQAIPQDHADLIHPDDLELEKILKEHRECSPAEETFFVAPELEMPKQTTAPKLEIPNRTPAGSTAAGKNTSTGNRQQRPAPKQDVKKKKKDPFGLPQFAATLIWLVLIFAIGLSVGRTLWAACTDVFAFGKVEYTASITIEQSDDIDDIAKMLHDAKLIRYPKLFTLFAELTGKDDRIAESGTFSLNSLLDYNAMINAMSSNSAAREEVEIVFPEGYTCAQIFGILEEEGVCTVADLEKCLADKTAQETFQQYWFLEGIELGAPNCLEGFLFPDTYRFYTNDDPTRVLCKFLNAFDARFTDRMKEDFETMKTRYAQALSNRGYSADYIEANPLTLHKVVIIASLIERETASDDESYDISSVIYNRLTNPGEFPFLNIDAALVYALDGKTELSEADKQLDSPYNTYLYKGLIPGAISNPGSNSLAAALAPNDTSYYYYALNPKTNRHHFTRTYREHINFLNSIG